MRILRATFCTSSNESVTYAEFAEPQETVLVASVASIGPLVSTAIWNGAVEEAFALRRVMLFGRLVWRRLSIEARVARRTIHEVCTEEDALMDGYIHVVPLKAALEVAAPMPAAPRYTSAIMPVALAHAEDPPVVVAITQAARTETFALPPPKILV